MFQNSKFHTSQSKKLATRNIMRSTLVDVINRIGPPRVVDEGQRAKHLFFTVAFENRNVRSLRHRMVVALRENESATNECPLRYPFLQKRPSW